MKFEENDWDTIVAITQQVFRDNKIGFILFKICHWYEWYPSRAIQAVWRKHRCEGELGTLTHALWSCLMVHTFWRRAHEITTEVLRVDFDFCPSNYILGNPKPMAYIVKPFNNRIRTSIMIGKQTIMRKWKTKDGPVFQDCLVELGKVAAFERLSCSMINYIDKYNDK